jgi:hypothetical protein
LLGHLAAQRLGNWRKHAGSQTALVEYLQRLLWGEHCANGRKLDLQKMREFIKANDFEGDLSEFLNKYRFQPETDSEIG